MSVLRPLFAKQTVDAAKLVLVAIPLLLPLKLYIGRFEHIGVLHLQLVYLTMLLLCVASTFAAAFVRNTFARVAYALLLASFLIFWSAYESALNSFMTYDAFIAMLHARGFIGDAFSQFLPQVLKAIVLGGILLIGVALPPTPRARRLGRDTLAWLAAPLVIAGITVVAHTRAGDGLQGLPGHDVTAAYLILLGIESYHSDVAPRESVALKSVSAKPDYDVILIVDESIRGDFLDVGSTAGVISNLLGGNPAVHSFGLAASGNNCSEGSNLLLRFGGTRDDYRATIDHMPSIFHYAKSRGFKTLYVDAQRNGRRLQNGMDAYELSAIDEFIQFDDVPVVDRDIKIAHLISARTRNQVPEFIYVNKVGAHFPVHDKYPDSFMRYTPALKRGTYASVTDVGTRSSELTWEQYKNSYRNTLLWNVGEFFRIILSNADLDHAFMLYTSDHGQDFGEKQSSFRLHCSPNPSQYEGLVPLVVISALPDWSEKASTWAKRNFNHSSHYNIFPTMLEVMGYSDPKISSVYGHSLFEDTHDPMTFNYRFYARFGQPPLWQRVVPPQQPPANGADR